MLAVDSQNSIVRRGEHCEPVFLLAIFLLASMYTLRFSKLDLIPAFKYVFMGMRLVSYGLVAIKFLIDFFYGRFKGYIMPVVIIGLYMALISYRSRTINYLTYYIYIVVGKDVDYVKIIKTAFLAIVASYIIVILLYIIKVIEEDFKIEGGRPRHSLGFKNAPIFSNFVFYSTLYYIYIRREKLRIFESLALTIVNVAILLITFTRSAFALGMLAIIAVTIVNNIKYFSEYKKWYSYVLYALPVFLPIFMLAITIIYNPNVAILDKLNNLLNGRLTLGHDALFTYGVKLFGQYIRFSSDPSTGIAYNIVDSAYILYLLILGVIFFILMIVFLEYFGRLINTKKDIYMFIIFVIILVHSTFDAQIFQLSNNYFMFLLSYKDLALVKD